MRLKVNLRVTSGRKLSFQSSMPQFESLLQDCSESQCFENIDFTHRYWQVPLDYAYQEIMAIQTADVIYPPMRTLQGRMDFKNHFQSEISEHFAGKAKLMIEWLEGLFDIQRHGRKATEGY